MRARAAACGTAGGNRNISRANACARMRAPQLRGKPRAHGACTGLSGGSISIACARACARARARAKKKKWFAAGGSAAASAVMDVSASQTHPKPYQGSLSNCVHPPFRRGAPRNFFSVHPPYFGFKVHYQIRLYTPFFGSKCYSVHVRNIVEDGIYTAAAADGVRLRHCQTHWSRVHSHALTAHCIAVCCYWQLLLLRSASLELSDWLCVYRYCSFLLL